MTRAYIKAMYFDPKYSVKSQEIGNIEAGFGLMFCPVNGLIDFCLGTGLNVNPNNLTSIDQTMWGAEAGFVINVWRFPITVMLHELDLIHYSGRRLYADFGIGFHFGEFKKSSYK